MTRSGVLKETGKPDQLENKVERQGDDNARNEIKKESDGGQR